MNLLTALCFFCFSPCASSQAETYSDFRTSISNGLFHLCAVVWLQAADKHPHLHSCILTRALPAAAGQQKK